MTRRNKRNRRKGSAADKSDAAEKKIGLFGRIKARLGRKPPDRDDDVWKPNSRRSKDKAKSDASKDDASDDVRAGGWTEPQRKVRWRAFCESAPINEPLRVDMSGNASTEVLAHARESLDEEVCGVLVGQVCEDDQGKWVSVKAAIRGTSTKKGGAHVTYTQETWDSIHEVKDRDYKKLDIVGWYHSHPGFGVTFSDMDKFIQQNFFSGETQFALVIDPLGGDEAVCVNRGAGVKYVGRIWIEGRQRVCQVPESEKNKAAKPSAKSESRRSKGSAGSNSPDLDRRLKSLERRMTEFLDTAEEDRAVRQQWILMTGGVVSLAAILWICLTIYDRTSNKTANPELKQAVPVGIQAGPLTIPLNDKAVITWKVPEQFMEVLLEIQERKLVEKEAKRKAEGEANEAKEKAAKEEDQE